MFCVIQWTVPKKQTFFYLSQISFSRCTMTHKTKPRQKYMIWIVLNIFSLSARKSCLKLLPLNSCLLTATDSNGTHAYVQQKTKYSLWSLEIFSQVLISIKKRAHKRRKFQRGDWSILSSFAFILETDFLKFGLYQLTNCYDL